MDSSARLLRRPSHHRERILVIYRSNSADSPGPIIPPTLVSSLSLFLSTSYVGGRNAARNLISLAFNYRLPLGVAYLLNRARNSQAPGSLCFIKLAPRCPKTQQNATPSQASILYRARQRLRPPLLRPGRIPSTHNALSRVGRLVSRTSLPRILGETPATS